MYFNHKDYHSIVVMGIADTDYHLVFIHVGSYGKDCDSSVFKQTQLWKSIGSSSKNIPDEKCLPGTEGPKVSYFIVGDAAFGLYKHFLRPYGGTHLTVEKRILNYRLCRQEGVFIENKMGKPLMDQRKAWILKLKIGKQVSKSMKVCSLHFNKDYYFNKGNN
nr:unnamed protein product [Callosobruchus chinensis]